MYAEASDWLPHGRVHRRHQLCPSSPRWRRNSSRRKHTLIPPLPIHLPRSLPYLWGGGASYYGVGVGLVTMGWGLGLVTMGRGGAGYYGGGVGLVTMGGGGACYYDVMGGVGLVTMM